MLTFVWTLATANDCWRLIKVGKEELCAKLKRNFFQFSQEFLRSLEKSLRKLLRESLSTTGSSWELLMNFSSGSLSGTSSEASRWLLKNSWEHPRKRFFTIRFCLCRNSWKKLKVNPSAWRWEENWTFLRITSSWSLNCWNWSRHSWSSCSLHHRWRLLTESYLKFLFQLGTLEYTWAVSKQWTR